MVARLLWVSWSVLICLAVILTSFLAFPAAGARRIIFDTASDHVCHRSFAGLLLSILFFLYFPVLAKAHTDAGTESNKSAEASHINRNYLLVFLLAPSDIVQWEAVGFEPLSTTLFEALALAQVFLPIFEAIRPPICIGAILHTVIVLAASHDRWFFGRVCKLIADVAFIGSHGSARFPARGRETRLNQYEWKQKQIAECPSNCFRSVYH